MPPSLKRILLVDDSPRDIEMTLDALSQHNLSNEVLTFCDSVEALDYLFGRGPFAGRSQEAPAVILLDLKMPKVDGLEVLRQIKEDPRLKLIPVVVLSSSREEPDLLQSYQLGANAYIVKPVQFQDFVEAVKLVGAFWAILNERPLLPWLRPGPSS